MGEPRIRLRVVGPEPGQQWEGERFIRIGRSDSLEVVLNDSSISRRHAEIEYTANGWVTRDLGSTNGTYLNGIRIGRTDRPLREGDLVQCGNIVLIAEVLTAVPIPQAEPIPGTPGVQVQAMTRQSLEQAADFLAKDVTRSIKPGQQLLSLLRAGRNLCPFDSLDDLLRQNLQNMVTALRARRGCVVLVNEGTGKLTLRAFHSANPADASAPYFSETVASRCFRSGQSLLCADVSRDVEISGASSVLGTPVSSIICALLRSPDKHLGVLHLDRGPSDLSFNTHDLQLADALAAHMSSAIESAQILQEKQRSLFIQTVIAFSQAIELRDPYTGGHAQRVTDYSLFLAEEMALSEADLYHLRVGAPLHDIGKIGIDDAVLRKGDRLTAAEFEQMKAHTVKGAALLETIPGLDPVLPIVRNHHERWDGLGYPDRLSGEEIAPLARLVAVVDSFDAMTTDRPYRVGLSLEEAFDQIESGAGSQFDPDCAAAFCRIRPCIEDHVRRHRSETNTDAHGKLYDVSKLLANVVMCA